MIVTRYKPLFSLSASYEMPDLGVLTDGLTVTTFDATQQKLQRLHLKAQSVKNSSTVYFEGTETPASAPVDSEPILAISTDEHFYFSITLADKERIKKLKFHSTPAIAKEIGFPLLYEGSINALNGPTIVTAREDVKWVPAVFTLVVTAAQSGSTARLLPLEIKDESNNIIDLKIQPAELNDKAVDGASAIPEFSYSVNASELRPGIYSFKAGNFNKKYLLTPGMEMINTVAIVRIIKNNFLTYKKSLADASFPKFQLLVPKV